MDQMRLGQLDELIEKLDNIKTNLENNSNYAVMWLGETLDFLNNDDLKMALWSYSKYNQALDQIDIEQYKKVGKVLQEKLEELANTAHK